MDEKAYKPVNLTVHPSRIAMTCDTALFCVSYWGELMSACAVKEAVNARRQLLLVDLSMTHPAFKKHAEIIAKGFGWDGIAFKYFNEHLTASNHPVNKRQYLANVLAGRIAVKDALDGSGWAVSNSRETHVFFSVIHPYILNTLSILNRCVRVYYPHGIDQPRRNQIFPISYLFRSRSLTTLVKTISRQKRMTWYGIQLRIRGLLHGQSLSYPMPFTGIDYGYTISPNPLLAPYLRIDPAKLRETVQRIAAADELFDQWKNSEANHKSSCIVLIQERGQSTQGVVSDRDTAAYVHLIKVVKQKFGYTSYWIKPHPRNSAGYYMTLIRNLGNVLPDIQIVAMTEEWCRLPVEILATRGRWGAVISLGSFSMPPWVNAGIPHYASIDAARIYDSGFLTKKGGYEDCVKQLRDEAIATILEDI
jgi:hypothetical protein